MNFLWPSADLTSSTTLRDCPPSNTSVSAVMYLRATSSGYRSKSVLPTMSRGDNPFHAQNDLFTTVYLPFRSLQKTLWGRQSITDLSNAFEFLRASSVLRCSEISRNIASIAGLPLYWIREQLA